MISREPRKNEKKKKKGNMRVRAKLATRAKTRRAGKESRLLLGDFRNVLVNSSAIPKSQPSLLAVIKKMVLTYESVDEILKCDHSNESY